MIDLPSDAKSKLFHTSDKTAVLKLPEKKGFALWLAGRTRMGIKWTLAASMIFFAKESIPPNLVLLGFLVAFLGAFLRFWASGVIVKNREIADTGPYALSRNPLYMGTYFIFLGSCIWIGSWALFVLGTAVLYVVYLEIIKQEEEKLLMAFGDSYRTYFECAPRFLGLPKLAGLISRLKSGFSMNLALKNKGYEGAGVVIGAYLALVFIGYIKSRYSFF